MLTKNKKNHEINETVIFLILKNMFHCNKYDSMSFVEVTRSMELSALMSKIINNVEIFENYCNK